MTHWNPENESTLEKYNGNWKMKHTMKNTNCNWKNAIETGKLKNWTWRYNGNIEGEKRNTRRRIQTATEKNAIETGKLKTRTWRYNGNIEEYNGNWTETLKKTMKPRKKSHWELKIENWKCFFGLYGIFMHFFMEISDAILIENEDINLIFGVARVASGLLQHAAEEERRDAAEQR